MALRNLTKITKKFLLLLWQKQISVKRTRKCKTDRLDMPFRTDKDK